MVRGGKSRAGHRGGEGYAGHGVRGSRDDAWDPVSSDEDPLRDLRMPDDDGMDTTSDEYVWPQFEEEED